MTGQNPQAVSPMRPAPVAVLVASLAIAAAGAAAQSRGPAVPSPPPNPATTGAPPTDAAPTGHRQPSQQSLPPRVREKEAAPAKRDPLGPLPQICRGC